MFIVAQALDLTTPMIQALPDILRFLGPVLALLIAVALIRHILPLLIDRKLVSLLV